MSGGPVKLGVAGVGRMGQLHLQKYTALGSVQIMGVFDPNPERAKEIASRFSVPVSPSYANLLFDVEAVLIASPTPTHFDLCKQAIQAGVHVFVEKPVTENADELRELALQAFNSSLIFQVGFLERFRLREALRHPLLSNPRRIEMTRLASSLGRESHVIDVVSDLMIHDIDLSLFIGKETPSSLLASGQKIQSELWDDASATLSFPSGMVAHLQTSRVSPTPHRSFRLFTDGAALGANLLTGETLLYKKDPGNTTPESLASQTDPLLEQAKSFLNAIQTRTQPIVGIVDAIAVMQTLDRIKSRLEQGNDVIPRQTDTSWKLPEIHR